MINKGILIFIVRDSDILFKSQTAKI